MAATLYLEAKSKFGKAGINWLTDTIKIALVGTGYVLDPVNHRNWSDVSASQVVGTGYTAGGVALSSKTVGEDTANKEAEYKAANVTFTALDVTTPADKKVAGVVIYKDTGTATTSTLIAFLDGADYPKITNGGDFTVQFAAEGAFKLS